MHGFGVGFVDGDDDDEHDDDTCDYPDGSNTTAPIAQGNKQASSEKSPLVHVVVFLIGGIQRRMHPM